MTKKKFKSAKIIGDTLAILQHSFDKLFEWGFKEMKNKSVQPTKKKKECCIIKNFKKIGGFLGIMGEEYYKKYDKLKQKEKKH